MPTMWFAKDGPRPDSQKGPGMDITSVEAEAIAKSHTVRFVGPEPPSINTEVPSESLKNVIFELEDESQFSESFPKVGFYLIQGLHPATAMDALESLRKNV